MRLRSRKQEKHIIENISDDHDVNLSEVLAENIELTSQMLGHSEDLVIRQFQLNDIKAALMYIDGLINQQTVYIDLLHELMLDSSELKRTNNKAILPAIKANLLSVGSVTEVNTIASMLKALLSGDSILLVEQQISGLALNTKGGESRGIESVTTQEVVRGPKEAFTERVATNVSLIRRRIKDPNLWMKKYCIGEKTQTDVIVTYLNGVANDDIVQELDKRLNDIKIDAILEGGYIEELVQDDTYTPFPTVYNSERPDAISAGILEGKIAIIVDGTPFVLLIPALFVDFLQSSEDYYQRSDIATLLRLLRTLAFFLALLTPSLYIALTIFHQEMVPTTLLISLTAQREGIPFPALVEALLMEVTFELLREAGIRLPSTVGSAISIVGALVLGQAAVDAGIVSATMVIVVSLTAICSFIFPSYNLAISVRILRFGFMFLAASFGLYGIFTGMVFMVLHLNSLRSFGIPYLTPLAPFVWQGQKDVFVRAPLWKKRERPHLISQKNIVKNRTHAPEPPNGGR
ncbi:spore germination protein KA [Amphibacillus marinus]|uniref:Spore germination protein KA n=1 Tax=Amphibacillus marinus TaxID=872970 RepID=A0A1H8Q0N8_9BACI|nr:spore germination protein [Amphibacillus marinus]SEO47795.1 spore germination protein KA [Amphibacillus marinus]